MAHLWHPDTCHGPAPCVLEIVDGHKGLVRVVSLCPHHRAMRATLADDDALFAAVLETNRTKNFAVDEIAKEMAVEHAAVPWRIAEDDSVVITSGETAARRARLQAGVNARVGPGKVVVE